MIGYLVFGLILVLIGVVIGEDTPAPGPVERDVYQDWMRRND